MGYYQGDFYRGARGDPGFFSFLGGLAKKAVGFIPGVGPIASAIIPSSASPMRALGTSIIKRGGAIVAAHPRATAAAGAGALAVGAGALGHHMGLRTGEAGVKGMHFSKRLGREVRNRRMNPCNGRALRRAIRRAHAFERIAKHVIGFSSPRKPKGHMYFKKRRKAK